MTTVLATVAIAIAGCGDDGTEAELARDTGFRRALERVGATVSPAGTGFGWIDARDLRAESGDASVIAGAGALGPGGEQLFEGARRIERKTGIDPLDAAEVTSLAGSYMFALRFEGTSPGRLADELQQAGARRRTIAGSTAFDLGAPGQAVIGGSLSPLQAFAARTAMGRDFIVLSRMDGPRASLLGEQGSALDDRSLDLASACVGEVAAARTFPGGFAHNPGATPDLLAIGSRPRAQSGGDEVLCTLDDSAEDAEARARAMETSFAPEARDAVTGEPMRNLVRAAEVETLAAGELHATRAELTLTREARDGLLFRALDRGSLATYTGSPPPLGDDG